MKLTDAIGSEEPSNIDSEILRKRRFNFLVETQKGEIVTALLTRGDAPLRFGWSRASRSRI